MTDDLPEKVSKRPPPIFTRLKDLSRWRRVAIGMWDAPTQGAVYGEQRLDLTQVMPFIQQVNQQFGVKLTPLHVFVKTVGDLFAKYPHFNVMLRRRRFYARATADVFLQVAIKEGGGDLSGIKVSAVDRKTIVDLAREVAQAAERVRGRQDKKMEKAKRLMASIPPLLMPSVVRFVDILNNDLGFNLSFMGVDRDAFGGCMVSNIGSFGLPHGYAPLVPASRVPMLFLLGAARDEVVAVDGVAAVKRMLTVTGTFDHRVYDGLQIAQVCEHVRARFEDPSWLMDELAIVSG
jgi:pyruvate dehydrogenase E2 component (dihydrolipoamide acetyltransferase)